MDIRFAYFDEFGSISLEELEELFKLDFKEMFKKYNNQIENEYVDLDEINIKMSPDDPINDYIHTEWNFNTMLKHSPIEIFEEEKDININIEINREESFPLCYKHLACADCCDCNDYSDICPCCINEDEDEVLCVTDLCFENKKIHSIDGDYLCGTCEKEIYTIFYYYMSFNIISPELTFDTILKYLKENEIDYRIIDNKIHINRGKDFAFELFLILTSEFRFSKIKSGR